MANERQERCPICRQPSLEAFRPFCSKRCADVDLGHWLSGRYAIPAGEPDEAEEAVPATNGHGGNGHDRHGGSA